MRLLERYFVTITLNYFEKLSALCINKNEYGVFSVEALPGGRTKKCHFRLKSF